MRKICQYALYLKPCFAILISLFYGGGASILDLDGLSVRQDIDGIQVFKRFFIIVMETNYSCGFHVPMRLNHPGYTWVRRSVDLCHFYPRWIYPAKLVQCSRPFRAVAVNLQRGVSGTQGSVTRSIKFA
jgi:hypothetical protein